MGFSQPSVPRARIAGTDRIIKINRTDIKNGAELVFYRNAFMMLLLFLMSNESSNNATDVDAMVLMYSEYVLIT